MTSASLSPGGGDHPEVVEIAALDEGILPAERSEDVRSHLDVCPLCADTRSSLAEVRDALGTLPGPPRMPDDIAGRIDAALAAEALLDATAPDVSRETDEPDSRGSDVSRETKTRETARPPGRPRGATGPGRSHRSGPIRRRRWRNAVLGAAALAVALGFGGFYLQSLGEDSAKDSVSQADTAQEGAKASDSLDQRVRHILKERETPKTSQENAPLEAPDPSAREDTSAGSLPSCVREGVARSEQPLAFDEQVFRGQEVYLVLFPHSGDPRQVDAYLVDADCVTDAPDGAGEVVDTGTYPRD